MQPAPVERRDFFAAHPPFDGLPADLLMLVAETAVVRDVADGECVLAPEDGPPGTLWVIAAGRVVAASGDDSSADRFIGEVLGVDAWREGRALEVTYRAAGATRLYGIPADMFGQCMSADPAFAAFWDEGAVDLLARGHHAVRQRPGDELSRLTSLDVTLRSLCVREPVTTSPGESVRAAVARMHRERVGSLVVVADGGGEHEGIFTLHDLRRVVADGGDLDAPLSAVMTPSPRTLPGEALAFEAVVLMARHHFRHVPVVVDGQVIGVVSERDLFARQQVNVVQIMRALNAASDVSEVVAVRHGIPPLIDGLLGHGAGAEQITRVLTLLNDRTVARVIELCIAAYGPPAVPFTWLAFGSEGRGEQTLHTDQDNGLLFDPGDEAPEAVRERLLPLAHTINIALDRCGFTLCRGNIMASNPALCLSVGEWRATFSRLIATTTPEHLLDSSIYFDLRPVWGDTAPAMRLRAHVREEAKRNTLFQRALAGNALSHRPALGWLRGFATERDEEGAGRSFDLKMRGLFPFVEGARVLALAGGIEATATSERLAALPGAGMASAEDAAAWGHAFAFLQFLRMQGHQAQNRAGEALSNRIEPDGLNPLDRRVLLEALRQGRGLQRRLAIRYQL